MKKLLYFLAGAVFAVSLTVFAQSSDLFTDDKELPSWAREAVYRMKDEGFVNGYEEGDFRPNQNVTRAEVTVMMNNLYEDMVRNFEYLTYTIDKYDVPREYRVPIVMARMQLKKTDQNTAYHFLDDDEPEYVLEYGGDVFEVHISYIDDYYDEYFVHYIPDEYSYGGDWELIDEWYGPFKNL